MTKRGLLCAVLCVLLHGPTLSVGSHGRRSMDLFKSNPFSGFPERRSPESTFDGPIKPKVTVSFALIPYTVTCCECLVLQKTEELLNGKESTVLYSTDLSRFAGDVEFTASHAFAISNAAVRLSQHERSLR